MAMESEDLIKRLAQGSQSVTRLRHPLVRAQLWFAGSIAYAAIVAAVLGLRPDLFERLSETRFLIELAAATLTSVMAAAAAFCAGCPGRPIWERFVALPFVALWIASLGQGCWQDWTKLGTAGLRVESDLVCLPFIAIVSFLPGAVMLAMIRGGAPIAPVTTTSLGALAAGALAAIVLRLTHLPDASIMVLVWQFGSVALLTALAAAFGSKLLRWPSREDVLAANK